MNRELADIVSAAGESLGGIQINQPRSLDVFSPLAQLVKFNEDFGHLDLRVILQIKPYAFPTTKKLVEWLMPYTPYISDILLDMSLGLGKQLTPDDAKRFLMILKAIHRKANSLGLGVAGGLADDNLSLLADLFKEFPSLNIDAETRLRDRHDNFDLDKASRYIINAFKMSNQYRHIP